MRQKKTYRQGLLLLLLAILTAGCENKWPKNGNLDGQWQLLSIEHKGVLTDMKVQERYLSFQLDLFQLSTAGNRQRYYGHFCHAAGRIVFSDLSDMAENDTVSQDNRPVGDADLAKLHPWGFYRASETFVVERLSKQELVLRSDSARITYRKF